MSKNFKIGVLVAVVAAILIYPWVVAGGLLFPVWRPMELSGVVDFLYFQYAIEFLLLNSATVYLHPTIAWLAWIAGGGVVCWLLKDA